MGSNPTPSAAEVRSFTGAGGLREVVLDGHFQDAFARPDPQYVDVAEATQLEVFLTGRGPGFRRPG